MTYSTDPALKQSPDLTTSAAPAGSRPILIDLTAESPAGQDVSIVRSARRGSRIGYALVLVGCLGVTLGRLVLGVLAELADLSTTVGARLSAMTAHPVAQALVAAAPEPKAQALLGYGFTLLDLVLAGAVLLTRRRDRSYRLLGLALVAVAGTGNLSVQSTAISVRDSLGLPTGADGDALLQATAFASILLALAAFPAGPLGGRGTVDRSLVLLGAVGFGSAGAVGLLLPITAGHAVGYVLLFGFGVPAGGLLVLRRRHLEQLTAQDRSRRRRLFSVLIALAAIALMLLVVTLLVWSTGWLGLTLPDPTAPDDLPGLLRESSLLFWFCRAAVVALAVCMLTAGRPEGLPGAERRFSHGLVVALVATQIGGLFAVLHTVVLRAGRPGREAGPAVGLPDRRRTGRAAALPGLPAGRAAGRPAALRLPPDPVQRAGGHRGVLPLRPGAGLRPAPGGRGGRPRAGCAGLPAHRAAAGPGRARLRLVRARAGRRGRAGQGRDPARQ